VLAAELFSGLNFPVEFELSPPAELPATGNWNGSRRKRDLDWLNRADFDDKRSVYRHSPVVIC